MLSYRTGGSAMMFTAIISVPGQIGIASLVRETLKEQMPVTYTMLDICSDVITIFSITACANASQKTKASETVSVSTASSKLSIGSDSCTRCQ
jgi:hypothetical protein